MKIAIIAIFFVAAFSQVVRERVAAGPVVTSAPVVERVAAPRVAAPAYTTGFVERVGAPVVERVAAAPVVERVGGFATPVVAESVYGGYPYGAYGAYPYETYGAYGAYPYGAYGAYPYAYGAQTVVVP